MYNKCTYMFQFNKTIIREPTMCALLKLKYWRKLNYFFIKMFGCVATQPNIVTLVKHTL
jgi:hypothetical protein